MHLVVLHYQEDNKLLRSSTNVRQIVFKKINRKDHNIPARSCLSVSHILQLKSSYPPSSNRPLLLKATLVIPQIILS